MSLPICLLLKVHRSNSWMFSLTGILQLLRYVSLQVSPLTKRQDWLLYGGDTVFTLVLWTGQNPCCLDLEIGFSSADIPHWSIFMDFALWKFCVSHLNSQDGSHRASIPSFSTLSFLALDPPLLFPPQLTSWLLTCVRCSLTGSGEMKQKMAGVEGDFFPPPLGSVYLCLLRPHSHL